MAHKVMVPVDPANPKGPKKWSGLWRASVQLPNGRRLTRTDPLKRVVDGWADKQRTAIRAGRWVRG